MEPDLSQEIIYIDIFSIFAFEILSAACLCKSLYTLNRHAPILGYSASESLECCEHPKVTFPVVTPSHQCGHPKGYEGMNQFQPQADRMLDMGFEPQIREIVQKRATGRIRNLRPRAGTHRMVIFSELCQFWMTNSLAKDLFQILPNLKINVPVPLGTQFGD